MSRPLTATERIHVDVDFDAGVAAWFLATDSRFPCECGEHEPDQIAVTPVTWTTLS